MNREELALASQMKEGLQGLCARHTTNLGVAVEATESLWAEVVQSIRQAGSLSPVKHVLSPLTQGFIGTANMGKMWRHINEGGGIAGVFTRALAMALEPDARYWPNMVRGDLSDQLCDTLARQQNELVRRFSGIAYGDPPNVAVLTAGQRLFMLDWAATANRVAQSVLPPGCQALRDWQIRCFGVANLVAGRIPMSDGEPLARLGGLLEPFWPAVNAGRVSDSACYDPAPIKRHSACRWWWGCKIDRIEELLCPPCAENLPMWQALLSYTEDVAGLEEMTAYWQRPHLQDESQREIVIWSGEQLWAMFERWHRRHLNYRTSYGCARDCVGTRPELSTLEMLPPDWLKNRLGEAPRAARNSLLEDGERTVIFTLEGLDAPNTLAVLQEMKAAYNNRGAVSATEEQARQRKREQEANEHLKKLGL